MEIEYCKEQCLRIEPKKIIASHLNGWTGGWIMVELVMS